MKMVISVITPIITLSQEKDNLQKVSRNNTPDNPRVIGQQDIRQFASILTRNGQVVEVRALNASLHTDRHPYDKPRVIAGWFNNAEALVSSVKQIASAEGIYITINPFTFRLKIGKQGLASCRERPWSSKVRKKEQ